MAYPRRALQIGQNGEIDFTDVGTPARSMNIAEPKAPAQDDGGSFMSAIMGLLKTAQGNGDEDLLTQRNALVNQRFNQVSAEAPQSQQMLSPGQQEVLRSGSTMGMDAQLGGINAALEGRANRRTSARQALMDTLGIIKMFEPEEEKVPTTTDITNFGYYQSKGGKKGFEDFLQLYAEAKDTSDPKSGEEKFNPFKKQASKQALAVLTGPKGKAALIEHADESNPTFAALSPEEKELAVTAFIGTKVPPSHMASSDPFFGVGGRKAQNAPPPVSWVEQVKNPEVTYGTYDDLVSDRDLMNKFDSDLEKAQKKIDAGGDKDVIAQELWTNKWGSMDPSLIDSRLTKFNIMANKSIRSKLTKLDEATKKLTDYYDKFQEVVGKHGMPGGVKGTLGQGLYGLGAGVYWKGQQIRVGAPLSTKSPEMHALYKDFDGTASALGQAIGDTGTDDPSTTRAPGYWRGLLEGDLPTFGTPYEVALDDFNDLFRRINDKRNAILTNPSAFTGESVNYVVPAE